MLKGSRGSGNEFANVASGSSNEKFFHFADVMRMLGFNSELDALISPVTELDEKVSQVAVRQCGSSSACATSYAMSQGYALQPASLLRVVEACTNKCKEWCSQARMIAEYKLSGLRNALVGHRISRVLVCTVVSLNGSGN